jgi:hypothetical protein
VVAGLLLGLAVTLQLWSAPIGAQTVGVELVTLLLGLVLLRAQNPNATVVAGGAVAGIFLAGSAVAMGGEFVVFLPLAGLALGVAVWNGIRERVWMALALGCSLALSIPSTFVVFLLRHAG